MKTQYLSNGINIIQVVTNEYGKEVALSKVYDSQGNEVKGFKKVTEKEAIELLQKNSLELSSVKVNKLKEK